MGAAMDRVRTASALGLATGVVGILLSLVPAISSLEDSIGLRWLFRTRGPLPPPPGVVVVSIDEAAAAHLQLPPLVRDWPRSQHARLIDRLVEQGASVIAFDLQFFRETATADDDALARAIAQSRRVVLVQWLERLGAPGRELWRRQDPLPAFRDGAAGLAPVPVPDTPLVSWFWTFISTTDGDESPTLPVVALQAGALRATGTMAHALRTAGVDAPPAPPMGHAAELSAYMRDLRRLLKGQTAALAEASKRLAASAQIDTFERQLVRSLIGLYAGDSVSYLNFYGPPGSICTVPYEAVVQGEAGRCAIRGATVFVGMGRSRIDQAAQIDTYHTVYGGPAGVDVSGVELHATAFANLLTGTALRPPGPFASFVLLIGIGTLLGASAYWIRTRRRQQPGGITARVEAAGAVTIIAVVYAVAAYILFARSYLTVPIVVPLAVQVPAALILGLLVRPSVHEETVRAVCLAADAGGSTAVGQRLVHDVYARLMTEYNRVLAGVASHGGVALPPHGDGFVALFVIRLDAHDRTIRLSACETALRLTAAANRFNSARVEGERLPLRIGLTVGLVAIRSDADRGVFEAVGDPVNVAARLQQANRELGTSVLASGDVVAGFAGVLNLHRIDVPLSLKGVARVPDIFELRASAATVEPLTD